MFDANLETPHRDFGAAAGLTAFYPLDRDLHLSISGMASYELSHFHSSVPGVTDITTGYFHYGFLQIPILLNHAPLHNNKQFFVIKEFFGFGLNVGNVLDLPFEDVFENPRYGYRTYMSQKWRVNPEFIIGLGLISRQLRWGRFHYNLSLHIDIAPNQRFEAWLLDYETNEQLYVDRSIRGIKGQISMTYYPFIQRKKKECHRYGR